ncbi:Cytochrome P450 [Corchorus olitorius]|uniref:Cytochrome P450 n=1 Tax=Corchorus olitorius TaxID=93759 RepID=A0A1R3JNV7_9ROSI|nr:Cytochrome P450 [Corchorus olitorius]
MTTKRRRASRLPAEYLHCVVRYVCKTWGAIICNPHFIESHRQRSKPGIIIQHPIRPGHSRLLKFKENGDFEITTLLCSFYDQLILNSCDGVSLFFDGSFYVANPTIGHVVKVPAISLPRICDPKYAMARVPNSWEFKLICGYRLDRKFKQLYITTVGIDDSWREMGSPFTEFVMDSSLSSPINVGPIVYWTEEIPCMRPFENIATDIAKESVYTVSIPYELRTVGFVRIGDYLGSITFSFSLEAYKIHVLKDDHLDLKSRNIGKGRKSARIHDVQVAHEYSPKRNTEVAEHGVTSPYGAADWT